MTGCHLIPPHRSNAARGFSLVGTLVAVLTGGVIAALIATVISQAVRGKRGFVDRDETSDLISFVRGILTADSTCSSVLAGRPFKKNGKSDLELNVGYGGDSNAVLKKGFSFAGGSLIIEELSIEDRSPNAVKFKIGVDRNGGVSEAGVERHLGRVKVVVKTASTDAMLRPVYFEIPVLFNPDSNQIELCNNEINVSDACQALGFRWDTTSSPPRCIPANACLYGGAYTLTSNGGCTANPATGSCACPANYQPVAAGSVNIQRTACFKGCDPFRYDMVYQCFWCPR